MFVKYKIFGLITNVTLIVNLFILLGVLTLFEATLTLPGIAGIILTVGMAVDASDRCKGYQTSCPFRNFKLKYAVASEDRRASEVTAHKLATEIAEERRGEWFKMPVADAIKVLNRLHECN